MPMQAWIDDSGAKGQGGCIALAGLIGEAQDWAVFADKWAEELAADPPLRYFSMSDAATRTGVFHRWPPWRRDAKVRRLARTVDGSKFTLVDVSVDLAAFAELFPKVTVPRKSDAAKRIRLLTEQPYFLCFHNVCTVVCLELLQRGITEQVDLFFDEQKILAPRVKEWYPIYLSALEPNEQAIMPADPIFRDDKVFLPLQVADLMAWIVRADQSGLWHPFKRIGKEMRGLTRSRYSQMWNRDKILEFAKSDFEQPLGSQSYEKRLREFLGMTGDA